MGEIAVGKDFFSDNAGHGGDLTMALERWSPPGGRMIDFSSSTNPLGPPPGLIAHLRSALPRIVAYPVPQARELRSRLAFHWDLDPGRLVFGNGANDLIHHLILWRRPRRVIVPAPAYSEYERAAMLAGIAVGRYFLPPGGSLDPEGVAGLCREGDLLVLCNPSTPSGLLCHGADLSRLAGEAASRGASVLLDESFLPLADCRKASLLRESLPGCWVVVSLTKLWALPGLRLGFAAGPAEEAKLLRRLGDPWRVNVLAQAAGLFCLEDETYLQKSLDLIGRERRYLERCLSKSGCFKVYRGAANYLLLEARDSRFNVGCFQAELARRGILIRRADNYTGLDHRHLRVAVRKRRQNRLLLQEMESCYTALYGNPVQGDKGGETH